MIKSTSYSDISKDLIHPWEKPMRVINVLIFFILVIASLALIGSFIPDLASMDDAAFEDLQGGFLIFGLLGITIISLGRHYGSTRASSVMINEKQFPEVHKIIVEYAEQLDLGYVPEAFVVQKGGVLNAFAASFFAKKYISINSDIFEVSYLEHKDINTLSFIIGHELCHLKRRHSTTLMTLLETPSRIIPIWSSAVSRVKEYTCDRHAAWLCPGGIDGLLILSIGKHLYKSVDVDEYIITSNNHFKGFFCWLTNLLASHPVLPKRIKALKNLNQRGQVF